MRILRNLERSRRAVDRLKPRRLPWLPTHDVRLAEKRDTLLKNFEAMTADGVSFVPDDRLPPWKKAAAQKTAMVEKKEVTPVVNYAGVKLRIASPGSGEHPGFPTHFQ